MHNLISNIQIFLLVIALSIDTFAVSVSYGVNKIKIPFLSALFMTFICTSSFALSLFLGSYLSAFVSSSATKAIAFFILAFLGIEQLFDSFIKNLIKKNKSSEKILQFKISDLKFVINIYLDPQNADVDKSKSLSLYESIFLAIALSIDGLIAGLSIGLVQINAFTAIITSFIINMIAITGGFFIGNVIGKKSSFNLSVLSGVMLILLAVMTIC